MNTNDYTNQLRALMDFYDTTGVGGPRTDQVGMFGGGGQNAANYAGARLRFAESALGGGAMGRPPSGSYAGMPDFFAYGNQPAMTPGAGRLDPQSQYPQYGANESVPANVIARRQGFPMQPGTAPSQMPAAPQNALTRLLTSRY